MKNWQTSRKAILSSLALLLCALTLFTLRNYQIPEQRANVLVTTVDVDATLNIVTQNTPVKKNVFGVQTKGFFDQLMYDRYNDAVFNSSTHTFSDPEPRLMENFYELKFKNFRYPGGAFSRYPHPSTPGSPQKGYGIDPSEVANDIALYGKDWMDTPNADTYVSNYQQYLPNSFTVDLKNVMSATGTGRSTTLVANIVYGTSAEIIAEIAELSSAGVNIHGVEIGNEHFNKIPGVSMTITEYLDKALSFAQAIKDAYPNMKIGLTAANAYPASNPDAADYLAWNQAIATAINTTMHNGAPLYDAYIAHVYKPFVCDPALYTGTDLTDCVAFKENNLVYASGNVPSSWGSLGSMPLSGVMQYYQNIFGPTTEMWLTEWGLSKYLGNGNSGDDDDTVKNTFANSIAWGVFMTEFYHFINRYNLEHNDIVAVTDYHSLAGSIGYHVMGPKEPGETFTDFPDSRYNRRIPWFALHAVKPIFNVGAALAQTQTTLSAQADYLNFTSYFDEADDKIYVYFSNTSGKTSRLASVTVDGIPLSSAQAGGHAEITYGSSLLSSSGISNFNPTGEELPVSMDLIDSQDVSTVVIPGYSFGFIRFKKPAVITQFACENTLDDDSDGLVDMNDPGCTSPTDDDEYNLVVLPKCSNTLDDDSDGLVDMNDPGCTSPTDDDEYNTIVSLTACNNNVDDDGDGLVDMNDPGCADASDNDEFNEIIGGGGGGGGGGSGSGGSGGGGGSSNSSGSAGVVNPVLPVTNPVVPINIAPVVPVDPTASATLFVSIAAPTRGEKVRMGQTINALAYAGSPSGIKSVTFYFGGKKICTDTRYPFYCEYSVPRWFVPYYRSIKVTAEDLRGYKTEQSTYIEVGR